MKIPMRDTDRVVAAFPYRDFVLVVTEEGEVFEILIGHSLAEDRIVKIQAR